MVKKSVAMVLGLAAGLLWPAAALPQADLLRSPECQRARVALDAAFEAFARKRPDATAQVRQARERAAQACFGTTLAGQAASAPAAASAPGKAPAPVARAEPSVQPPIAVPPPDLQLRPATTLSVPRSREASPPVVPPPMRSTVTSCDAGGCWDDQGRRINRVGQTLVGPNGPCTIHGVFATCP